MNVFLEGYSFVGKTTLLGAVGAINDSFMIIDEHDVYAKGIDNYPAFPSPTEDAARENVDFFYELERQRHQDALDVPISIFDRSVFSVILFQKYIASLKLEGHVNAYQYAKEEAVRLIQVGLVTVPDTLIYIRADYETIVERYGREVSVGLLRGKGAYNFFQEQYAIIEGVYARYGLLQAILSSNDKQATQEQAQAINYQIGIWNQSKPISTNSINIAKEVIKAI